MGLPSSLRVADRTGVDPRTAARALEGKRPRSKLIADAIFAAVADLSDADTANDLKAKWEKAANDEK